MAYVNVFCVECGCEDIEIHKDGTCECLGCGFVWRLDKR